MSSLSRIASASFLIFVTTADDALWLIPMLSHSKNSFIERCAHCLTFVLTLQMACFFSWIISIIFTKMISVVTTDGISLQHRLELCGVVLCWAIAIGLFIKSEIKRRKRLRNEHNQTPLVNQDSEKARYNSIPVECGEAVGGATTSHDAPQIATVMTLTLLGALDEIICFPMFIINGSFSYMELSVGCFVASLTVVMVVLFMLKTFKPLLEFFDTIPLYGIIAVYALMLTISLFI